jgi:two-component system, LytTR family, response regulator
MNSFRIRTSKGTRMVLPQHIIRVEASSCYCKIYFNNEYPLTVAKLLRWFEEKLPDNVFFRIHRTHIVNRDFISTISENNKLRLVNGEELKISRRKRKTCLGMVA